MIWTSGKSFDPFWVPKSLLAWHGGGVNCVLTIGLLSALEAKLNRPARQMRKPKRRCQLALMALTAVICLFVGSAGLVSSASAADRPLCADIDISEETSLERLKLCHEIAKLRAEVATLETANKGPLGSWLPYSNLITGVLGGMFTFVVAVLGFLIRGTIHASEKKRFEAEADKLRQERKIARETHIVRLMEAIGSNNRSMQLTASSGLLRRFEEIQVIGDPESKSEARLLQDVLFAMLRDPEIDDLVSKFVADQMVKVFRLRREGQKPRETLAPLVQLASFDLSNAKLKGVSWQRVEIEGCELYRADFQGATLRGSNLERAICYETNFENAVLAGAKLGGTELSGAILRGANLCDADFTGARNIHKAVFSEATMWNDKTKWPDGFRPDWPPVGSP